MVRQDLSEEFLSLARSELGSAMAVGKRDDRPGLGQYRFAAVTRRQVLQGSSLGMSVNHRIIHTRTVPLT